jgi:TetR/AcrR family transcriptional regulator
MPSHADSSRDKRARILQAAYWVCERCGVDGARMEEVAALARVSKGTLYRFFESKEHLLLATIIDSYEQSLSVFDAPVESDAGPRERLDALVGGMTRILEEVSPHMSVHYQAWGLVAKVPVLQERLYGFLRGFHSQRAQTVESAVREGQRRGVFRPDADARAFADGFQAILSGFLYRATFDPERARPEQLRTCLDAMVRDALCFSSTRRKQSEPTAE